MYLKSLEIKGFKSFVRKTSLEFEPGVVIIVGPNGSGKSNIADAVMWVLGEQSPTSLRGNRMEDIIFSGSAGHRPVNLAEVTLTLDNSRGDFPLDFSEVSITRNVFRGGDSEYLLNNTSCRLLDIQELLSDAGVGRTLNSVISQGNLDEVLNCRPEERRAYVEEAGGLLKFRRRRDKAQRRLERMRDELDRVGGVARELKRQLRPLERQAEKLEEYRTLSKELTEARLRLDVARLSTMQAQWKAHLDSEGSREERAKELEEEIARLESEARLWEEAGEARREREAALRERLYQLVSVDERLRALLPVWEERKRLARAGLRGPDREGLERLASEVESLKARTREIAGRLEGVREAEESSSSVAVSLKAGAEAAAREKAALQARLEVLNKGGVSAADQRIRARLDDIGALREERDSLAAEAAGHAEARMSLRDALSGFECECRAAARRVEEILSAMRYAAEEQSSLATLLDNAARLDSERGGVLQATAGLMRDDPARGGLGGMLIQGLTIEEPYERAVLSYLGPWSYALIASDDSAIKAAIKHLKGKELGQSLFLKHQGGEWREAEASAIDGAVPARDQVSSPDFFENALDMLLDGVYIVEGLDEAFELARSNPRLTFLTKEGDTVAGGTMVKGGSATVGKQLREMAARRRDEMEEALAASTAKLDSLALELESVRGEAGESEAELARVKSGMVAADDSSRQRAEALASLATRIEIICDDAGHLGEAADKEAAAECEVKLVEVESRLSDLEKRAAKAESARVEQSARIRDLSAELSLEQKRLETCLEAKEKLSRVPDEGAPAFPDGEVAGLIGLHERLLARAAQTRLSLRDELDSAPFLEGSASQIRARRERMSTFMKERESLRELSHADELGRAELKVKVEQLVERIVDEHKVPLEFALKQYADESSIEELEAKVTRLFEQMEHIGPVNPEALADHGALEDRYSFFREQMDDIERAGTQLKRVITEIDSTIERRFKETVEAVDGHFREIFSTLFPGGAGEIRLTDPDDLLNSGIEIYVQPEGKRLRRLSLLSGGETSLCALAFFFALFRVRPSPFYFLDEVEAALDDVNLHRFLDMVREFKKESQLILITHQKRSMEIADILYGVSMQEDGISRVVSKKMAG